MTLQEIINLAQSLTDTTFDNSKWVTWVNAAINALSGAVTEGFKRVVVLDVTAKQVTLPPYLTIVNKIYYSQDGTTYTPCDGYDNPSIEGNTDHFYYIADGKINLSWDVSSGKIKIFGECSPSQLTLGDLAVSPEFILPEFHDMLSLYAAALANLADDETDRHKLQMNLYDTRFSLFMRKMSEVAKPPSRNIQMKSIRYYR